MTNVVEAAFDIGVEDPFWELRRLPSTLKHCSRASCADRLDGTRRNWGRRGLRHRVECEQMYACIARSFIVGCREVSVPVRF